MSPVTSACAAVNKFFFEETSPASLCLFRISLGLLIVTSAVLMAPDLYSLFGPAGVVSVPLVEWWYQSPHFSIINMFPHSRDVVLITWTLLVASSLSLTLGWHTRISALVALFCLTSFAHRNPFVVNSGDTLLRLFCFMLIFSAAGAMYSLDSRGKNPKPTACIWIQRLIQLQIAGMYCQTFFCKVIGSTWQDGTALYWALKLQDYARFPIPIIPDHLWLIQICTWATLLIEFSLFTLIWVRPIRYYVLAMGVLLHLGIDYAMTIPVFEWITMASYLAFVDPQHVEQAVSAIKARLSWHRRKTVLVMQRSV